MDIGGKLRPILKYVTSKLILRKDVKLNKGKKDKRGKGRKDKGAKKGGRKRGRMGQKGEKRGRRKGLPGPGGAAGGGKKFLTFLCFYYGIYSFFTHIKMPGTISADINIKVPWFTTTAIAFELVISKSFVFKFVFINGLSLIRHKDIF